VKLRQGFRPNAGSASAPAPIAGIEHRTTERSPIVLSPQYIRRPLLVLASLAALLLAGVATASAEYGEVGSPINLTSSVNLKSNGLPYVFGRDPSDGSFYVGDEIE